MQPGQQPPNRNTRLSLVARNALRPLLGDETAAEIEKQVEAGKLSLADLDNLADKGQDIGKGVLSLIFGTANPQDVALAFLAGDRHDAEIEKKAAGGELLGPAADAFEIELPAGDHAARHPRAPGPPRPADRPRRRPGRGRARRPWPR